MGKTLNIVWSVLTALLTLGTTGLMGFAVLTSHWEIVTYSEALVIKLANDSNSNSEVQQLYQVRP